MNLVFEDSIDIWTYSSNMKKAGASIYPKWMPLTGLIPISICIGFMVLGVLVARKVNAPDMVIAFAPLLSLIPFYILYKMLMNPLNNFLRKFAKIPLPETVKLRTLFNDTGITLYEGALETHAPWQGIVDLLETKTGVIFLIGPKIIHLPKSVFSNIAETDDFIKQCRAQLEAAAKEPENGET